MNRVKGEVWDISMAEPMDLHQKGIWNHPKIFRPLMALWSFSNNIFEQNTISNYFSFMRKVWGLMSMREDTVGDFSSKQMPCVLAWRTLHGKRYCFVLFVLFWSWKSSSKTYLTISVPIKSSHLDVNGLIREARLSALHLFLIYSCQKQAKAPQHVFSCWSMTLKLLSTALCLP